MHCKYRSALRGLLFVLALSVLGPAVAKPPSLDTKYSEPYIKANLIVDKTTMQQVLEAFGEPTARDRTRGMGLSQRQRTEETWKYDRGDEKAKPGVLAMIRRKSGAVVSLLGGGNSAASAASDVHYGAMRAENEVGRKTDGAQELLGVERKDDPEAVAVLRIYFKNGVVGRVEY